MKDGVFVFYGCCKKYQKLCGLKKYKFGTSLAVQWLRPCASTEGGTASTPGLGTKIPHAVWCGQKKEKGTNLLFYYRTFSEGQKFNIGLPGLKSRCWQGYVPFTGSRGESVFLLYPASRVYPHSLACGSLPPLQSHQNCLSLTIISIVTSLSLTHFCLFLLLLKAL